MTKRKQKSKAVTVTKQSFYHIFKNLIGYVAFKDAKGWHALMTRCPVDKLPAYAKKKLENLGYHKKTINFLTSRGRKIYALLFGKNAFLDPDRLRYPYVNPLTGKPSIKGLIAAAFWSYVHGHSKIFKKALKKLRTIFRVAMKLRGALYTATGKRVIRIPNEIAKRLKHIKV